MVSYVVKTLKRWYSCEKVSRGKLFTEYAKKFISIMSSYRAIGSQYLKKLEVFGLDILLKTFIEFLGIQNTVARVRML